MAVQQWQLDNPYITRGYRTPGSYRGLIKELFTWHNETINIWTMISASLLSIWMTVNTVTTHDISISCKYISVCFTGSAVLHCPFSVAYHLFLDYSEDRKALYRYWDIQFILISSVIVTFCMSFYVFPFAITMILTLFSTILSLHLPRAASSTSSCDKPAIFELVAKASFIFMLPMFHIIITAPLSNASLYAIGNIISLFIGGMAYITHFPEVLIPNTFDYIGASHQIMHICVTASHYFEYKFILESCILLQHYTKNKIQEQ